MFEIHITAEKLPQARRAVLFAALLKVLGLTKNKLFYQVVNLITTEEACGNTGTPPTGHDLPHPGSMTTAKCANYAEARRLVLDTMHLLAKLGVNGNFEIERIITPDIPDAPLIDPEEDFPGFEPVDKAPLYEDHIVWKGPRYTLPSVDTMNKFFMDTFGVALHQVVDFGRDAVPTDATIVSRVATIYQPTREATLAFAKRFAAEPNVLGCRNLVAEQVVLVGKPVWECSWSPI